MGTGARHWNLVSRKALGSSDWSVLFIGMQQSQSLLSIVSSSNHFTSYVSRSTTNRNGCCLQKKIVSTSESESSSSEIELISAELSGNKILMFMKQKLCRLKEKEILQPCSRAAEFNFV